MYWTLKNTFKKTYRVYGAVDACGIHRMRESFFPSRIYDFSEEKTPRIIEVHGSDITGSNMYIDVIITSTSEDECDRELLSQMSDGLFECSRIGLVECLCDGV